MAPIHADTVTQATNFDPFSHLLYPNSIDTILRYLSTYERLTVRSVSKAFAAAVQRPTIWHEESITYVHDSETSSASPFTHHHQQQTSFWIDPRFVVDTTVTTSQSQQGVVQPGESGWLINPNILVVRTKNPAEALPPSWIRDLVYRLRLDTIEFVEFTILLPHFHSIRSLYLNQPLRGARNQSSVMRSAFVSLHRLEELIVEKYDAELVAALFGSRTSSVALFASFGGDSSNIDPAVRSWCKTLTRLQIKEPSPNARESISFRYFAFAMSQRVWKRLEVLRCPLYVDANDVDVTNSTRICCEKLFSRECLPEMKSLSLGGDVTDKFIASEHGWLFSGSVLPSLLSLHHKFDACIPSKPSQVSYKLKMDSRSQQIEMMARPIWMSTQAEDSEEVGLSPSYQPGITSYPMSLTQLHAGNFSDWDSIARLRQLTQLRLNDLPAEIPSRSMFEAIGHHNLPHLATLSVPCRVELNVASEDRDRVLELMSKMTSLTALHSESVASNQTFPRGFLWFRYLYLFLSLKKLAFIPVPAAINEYRTIPLPLPVGVTLTPNQHTLYPDGGVFFSDETQAVIPPIEPKQQRPQTDLLTPEWMLMQEFTVDIENEMIFRERQRIKLISTDRFRAEGQLNPPQVPISRSFITPIRSGVFSSVMTDLCMVTMLKFLTLNERVRNIFVSRHFRTSVHHPVLWRDLTLDSSGLPSKEICRVLGGYQCAESFSDVASQLIHFSHLKRLYLHGSQISSSSELHDALNALRLEKLSLSVERAGSHLRGERVSNFDAFFRSVRSAQTTILTPTPLSSTANAFAGFSGFQFASTQPTSSLVGFPGFAGFQFGDSNDTFASTAQSIQAQFALLPTSTTTTAIAPTSSPTQPKQIDEESPLISSYATLRHLALTVTLTSQEDSHVMSTALISHQKPLCVWPQLHTLQVHINSSKVKLSQDTMLPFEELLVHSPTMLPQLTSLEFFVTPLQGLPLRALERIFAALTESKSLVQISHCFRLPSFLSRPIRAFEDYFRDYKQHYPPHLTSLTIRNQLFHWQAITHLHSLTELRLLEECVSTKPVELFDMIGSHALPALVILSIEVRTVVYQDLEHCARDSAHVCAIMSKMTSLTSLECDSVHHTFDSCTTQFNWFMHAYLFSSLKRIEYWCYSYEYGRTVTEEIKRHTLLQIPPLPSPPPLFIASVVESDVSSSLPQAQLHHLYPGSSFHPAHIYCPVEFKPLDMNASHFFAQDITVQQEYEHLSIDELRIIQQDAYGRGIDIPLRNTRVQSSATTSGETFFQVQNKSNVKSETPAALSGQQSFARFVPFSPGFSSPKTANPAAGTGVPAGFAGFGGFQVGSSASTSSISTLQPASSLSIRGEHAT